MNSISKKINTAGSLNLFGYCLGNQMKTIVLFLAFMLPFVSTAQLTEGNSTFDLTNPGGASFSFSHTQDAGSDGHLVIVMAVPSQTVASVTYNGVAMTEVLENNTSYSVYWSVWELDDPSTGSNTVSVTLDGAAWNPISTVCYSFTECAGVGNTGFNNVQATAQTTSVTISENSMIIGASITGAAPTSIEVPQSTATTMDWNANMGNYHFGGISTNLTAGSKTVEGNSTGSTIMLAVEVQEEASGPNVKDNNTTNLDDAGSWTTSVPTSGEVATWESTVTGANTTVLGSDIEFQGIAIDNPGGLVTINSGNTLTIGTSGIDMADATQSFTMNNAVALVANQTWDVNTSRTLTAAGVVSGAYKIDKDGAGTLTLSGANTFTGGVDHNAGTLNINNASALGTTAGTFTIANGTTIDNTSGGGLDLSNYPITIGGSFTYTGTNDLDLGNGAVTLTASPDITASANELVIGGIVSGAYGITKSGAGELRLEGANTFTGGVDLNAGELELGNANSMGTTAGTIYIGSGTSIDNISGGTLNLDDYNYEFEGDFTFIGTNSMNMGSGNVVLTANTTLSLSNSTLTIDGVISGAYTLDKDGPGHLYLTNTANTFTGKITIDHTSSSAGAIFYNTIGNVGGGASSLGAPTNVANGTISIGNGAYGGKLMFLGSSDQSTDRVIDLASTTGEVQLDAGDNANLTFTSDFTATGAGSKTLALRGTTTGNTISGDIVNNSGGNTTAVDKRESGTWIFTADMSYTGTTTISDGILQLGNGGTTGSLSSTSIVNSGTLAINRSNDWIYSGVISGTGALTKSGAGKLTLSGANTFTGNTTINEGTIELGAADRISNSSEVVFAGGTLSTGSGSGYGETVGVMTLTDSSTLALGSGNHTISFAASNGSSWTSNKLLTITGWQGGYDGTAAGGSDPKVFVGSGSGDLTAGQLEMIAFLNGDDSQKYLATLRSDGELVPMTTLLPVDLIEFSVRWEGDEALITWATASEINADYFDVQWSIDGENFYSIGEVSASGNTAYRTEYSFVHDQPELVNYYRLYQYDFDGKKYRKPTIVLSRTNGEKATIHPNPIGLDGNLYFDSPVDDSNASIRIIDGAGKIVFNAMMPIAEGVNMINLPSYSWLPGYYNLEIISSEGSYNFTLLNP